MDDIDTEIPVKAKKAAAKKVKEKQVEKTADAVFVCLDPTQPSFSLILDGDYKIRGMKNKDGQVVFKIPAKDVERVRQHYHVTTGRLVEA